jgi:transcriptional regulator with XRE-family HTH domain
VEKTPADLASILEFGRRLRAFRDAKGLTQEKLAERAGIDSTTVGGIEQGIGNPTLLTIVKIARALERSCADFFPAG